MAASIPLNTFKTTTLDLTTTPQSVYTCPASVTTVVLLAQVSNINTTSSITVSANFIRSTNVTSIIKNTIIPINDAGTLLSGKLILQTGDSFSASCSTNNSGQLILSYLETANQ
jgi:hypothetical protein